VGNPEGLESILQVVKTSSNPSALPIKTPWSALELLMSD